MSDDLMTPEQMLSWRIRAPRDRMRLQDAQRAGEPFLLTRDADDVQRIVTLVAGSRDLTLGRDEACDVSLPWDKAVSRVHAELRCVGGLWTLVDDGLSTNGTWVNGQRLASRIRLNPGDIIRVGDTTLEFHQPAAPDSDLITRRRGATAVEITPSQRRVLVALARPYAAGRAYASPATNAEIAAELVLTVDAVKAALRVLFRKFAIDGLSQNQKRAKLVELALEFGVISEPELR